MNRIENYIAKLSRHVSLEPKELEEFKHEIRSHLTDTVKALQQEGYSEEESMSIALKRFGEEEQLNTELRKLYRFQKGFKKSMLIASCLMLVLSAVCILNAMSHNARNSDEFDNMLHGYHNLLAGKVTDSSITQEEMEAYFKDNKRIVQAVSLLQMKDSQPTDTYTYPASMENYDPSAVSYVPFKVENDKHEVIREFRVVLDRSALFSPLPHILTTSAMVCFALYWILFGLWNVMNAYRLGRLNIFWVILFFTLNIAAFLLFRMVGRIQIKLLKTAT